MYCTATPCYVFTAVMALVLVGIAVVVYYAYRRKARALKKVSDEIVERRPERLRNILWNPMHQELSQVVAAEGVVTDPKSGWARISAFAKSEADAKFQHGMDEYLRQRLRVVDVSEGLPQAGPVAAEIQAERDKLVETCKNLLYQIPAAIRSEPPTPGPQADTRSRDTNWKKYEGR